MQEIVIATKNKGKAKEFEKLFSSRGVTVKTLLDFSEIEDIEETGKTFEENAILKAESVSKQLNRAVIADDSGLMVDELGGAPGIYSARYAGEAKDDNANIEKLLLELKGVPKENRKARFYCALAVALPGTKTYTVSGTCEGEILTERRGENGFGYDPIFFVYETNCSMAELEPNEKNIISHRANALHKLASTVDEILSRNEVHE